MVANTAPTIVFSNHLCEIAADIAKLTADFFRPFESVSFSLLAFSNRKVTPNPVSLMLLNQTVLQVTLTCIKHKAVYNS